MSNATQTNGDTKMTTKPKSTLSPAMLEMAKKMGLVITPAIETANRRRLAANRRDFRN